MITKSIKIYQITLDSNQNVLNNLELNIYFCLPDIFYYPICLYYNFTEKKLKKKSYIISIFLNNLSIPFNSFKIYPEKTDMPVWNKITGKKEYNKITQFHFSTDCRQFTVKLAR